MNHSIALTYSAESELSLETDRRILSLLGREPSDREAFRMKEKELGELFATLTIGQAKALFRRLSIPAEDDLVAAQFARLPYEGRSRLTLFLSDARRRQAHQIVGYR